MFRIAPKIITLYKYVQTDIFLGIHRSVEYDIFTKHLPSLGYYKYFRDVYKAFIWPWV